MPPPEREPQLGVGGAAQRSVGGELVVGGVMQLVAGSATGLCVC
jgi:hypothetical protein